MLGGDEADPALGVAPATSMLPEGEMRFAAPNGAHSQALEALRQARDIENRYANQAYSYARSSNAMGAPHISPVAEIGGTSSALEDSHPAESPPSAMARFARTSSDRNLRGYVPFSNMGPAPPEALYQEAAAFSSANDPDVIAAAKANRA